LPLIRTITELTACGLAVALSPLDIALVFLLLLGAAPFLRSSLFSLAWFFSNSVAITLLLTVGRSLTLSMERGGVQQVGLDLFAAGALLALGIRELDPKPEGYEDLSEGWIHKLEKVGQLPLAVMMLVAPLTLVLSPDNLFLLAKGAALLQGGNTETSTEIGLIIYFSLISSVFLLIPILFLLVGRQKVQPWLEKGKQIIEDRSSLILGGLSLALAIYLGWQGWSGLGHFQIST
jgi:hypothetical protein